MDFVTLVVALLPLLVGIAILFAKKGYYGVHRLLQIIIFVTSLVIVGYFEYGVRLGGGYEAFAQKSHVSHNYLLAVLVVHIVIAVITLGIWGSTLFRALKESRRGGILPGVGSRVHRRAGVRAFVAIAFTSLTGIWVYLLLFVY